MIIETMALGCLVVHGDIPDTQTNKFLGAYSADQIMKMLEGLHPGFYPEPVQMTTGTMADGKKHHHLEILTNEYLLKKTLVRYYARCGDVLHRGTVKKLQKASRQTFVLPRIRLLVLCNYKNNEEAAKICWSVAGRWDAAVEQTFLVKPIKHACDHPGHVREGVDVLAGG
jgi:hypothetical protein